MKKFISAIFMMIFQSSTFFSICKLWELDNFKFFQDLSDYLKIQQICALKYVFV